MTKITGHFDGKVIIPQNAARLKPNQQVTIEGEPSDPGFGTLDYVWRNMPDPLPSDVAEQMLRDIEDACENIEPEPDVHL